MIDNVTSFRKPRVNQTYAVGSCGTDQFPQAKWAVHRAWRLREKTVYQDLRRHPWRDVMQATRPFGHFAQIARGVDKDMHDTPLFTRLRSRGGGVFPIVQGRENGPGPNPWFDSSPAAPDPGAAAFDRSLHDPARSDQRLKAFDPNGPGDFVNWRDPKNPADHSAGPDSGVSTPPGPFSPLGNQSPAPSRQGAPTPPIVRDAIPPLENMNLNDPPRIPQDDYDDDEDL